MRKTTKNCCSKMLAVGISAIVLAFGLVLQGCATTEVRPEGSLIIKIGELVPPPQPNIKSIADGSYVCSRAQILRTPSLTEMLFGGKRITYANTKYVSNGPKSVAIRVNNGKITEIMAVSQGRGETQRTYATATNYYSVEMPVLIPSGTDLDKVADFNEARSMIH